MKRMINKVRNFFQKKQKPLIQSNSPPKISTRYISKNGKEIQKYPFPALNKKVLKEEKMQWEQQYNIMYGGWNGTYHNWWLSQRSEDKVNEFELRKQINNLLNGDIKTLQLENTEYYQVSIHFDLVNEWRYHSCIFIVSTSLQPINKLCKFLMQHFYDVRLTDEANGGTRYNLQRLKKIPSNKNLFEF